MKGIRASIIINNYNYGRYLPDAIESALQQKYPDKEIIVVDDGSTDNSRDIMMEFGDSIQCVFKSNGGQASCFNTGFLVSTGKIIFLLDADDFYKPGLVEKVVATWKKDAVKIHWPLIRTNPEGKPTTRLLPDDELIEGNLRDRLILGGPSQCGGPPNSPPTSGKAWSREFLEQVLPMPEEEFRQGADNYLFVLAPLFGCIYKLEEPLGFYRVHGHNNTSRSAYRLSYFNRFEACAKALSYHLAQQGIQIDYQNWPRDHWYHKVEEAMSYVRNVVPEGSAFILMDENHWVTDKDFYGRKRIMFLDRDGEFDGAPADDKAAIEHIEEAKNKGAAFVVIPWSCFWYFSHYSGMKGYLDEHATCCLANDLVQIFDLRTQND
jgi:glycosyltransferase involved in cell wall biosynthesis